MSEPEGMMSGLAVFGSITSVQGSSICAYLPQGCVGDLCYVTSRNNTDIPGQIVSFSDDLFSLALFDTPEGIYPRAPVRTHGRCPTVSVGPQLLGRVINPLGAPLDRRAPPRVAHYYPVSAKPPPSSGRPAVDRQLKTGIRAIDGFCSLGKGQRMGIFASAGVGKSTLLAMITQHADVDVIVVALVGERGREVQEFIDETLGPQGLTKSVIVVATSDDSSLMRQTAPYTATAIAEYFRDQGKEVLLIVDSLTRLARAIRETSIAAGDLPVRQGYTNSVYTQLPKLVERAGRSATGSITALYTILTNHEEDIDPLAEEIKSLLDGHITLRKEIAELGILPAIDITQSVSRVFSRIIEPEGCRSARIISRALARLIKERQIILLGGIPDDDLRRILNCQERIVALLNQPSSENSPRPDLRGIMVRLAADLEHPSQSIALP